MRYVIIPIAIILYIWWSYKSIKDLWHCRYGLEIDDSTALWIILMIIFATVTISRLSIIYW